MRRRTPRDTDPDADLRRELEFHLDEQAADLISDGVPPDEARRRARLLFGGVAQAAESCRDTRRWRLLGECVDDLRFALRLARRTPVLTATIVLALGLGIGASAAIFAVVDGVLFRPLPYRDPDRLVMLWSRAPGEGREENTLSPADYLDFAARTTTLERLEGYFSFLSPLEIVLADRTEVAYGQVVTPGLFETLGRTALRGRTLARGDTPEAVLSHGYWQRRFGGDVAAVGRTVRVGAQAVTIVGVMPPDFVFPYPGMLGPSGFTNVTAVDMWVSMAFSGPMAAEQRTVTPSGEVPRAVRFLGAIGRMRAEATPAQVQDDAGRVARDLEATFPRSNTGWGATVVAAREQVVGKTRSALLLLFAGVGLVLVMATVNIANLMLSRSIERRGEYAVRVALGASRARMVRQSLVESLLLAAGGALVGLAAAFGGIRLIVRLAPADIPRLAEVGPDWRMLAATFVTAAASGVLVGLLPAMSAAGHDPQSALRDMGRTTAGSRRQRRYLASLLVAQVALACVLTVGALLLLRSFSVVTGIDPGFNPDGLLTWQMNLPDRLRSPDERRAFYRELFDRLEHLPGVVSAGGTTRLPLGSTSVTTSLEVEGRPVEEAARPEVEFRRALHRYFETMQIQVVQGRAFTDVDGPDAPPVAVINQTMARQLFPGGQAIGQRVRTGGNGPWMEIVGIVGDVRHAGLEQAPAPELYISYLQNPPVNPFLVIRTSGDPSALIAGVREEAQRLDRDLPLYAMRTMSDVRAAAMSQRRFILALVLAFGALSLVLAAVGIEGVMAVSVNERLPEMSVRLALGADRARLWRSVVAEAARTTLFGLGAGLILVWLLAPAMRDQLFGVQPLDPLSLVAVVLFLLGVSVVAATVPARRAAHADPARALRGA